MKPFTGLYFVLSTLLAFRAWSAPEESEQFNPKPLPDDLVLPMPDGGSMAFRAVGIGVGGGAFASRTFKMGDRAEGGFQEYPTDVSLGGVVLQKMDGKDEWVYFLGKYEISEAQFYRVTGTGTAEQRNSALPVHNVSWFEVADFINRYNLWLYENARDHLPVNRGRPCFLRLPTEAEWEFAARGGTKVTENQFDRKHPYEDAIKNHEWYGGPESSHNKIKRIGRLAPNVLGLHDMLGNVSEMTCSNYSIEYYQGRIGGIVTRGAHYFSKEGEVRSSYRNELPVYGEDFKPARQETLGFRLVVASQIFVNAHVATEMEAEWETYHKSRVVPTLPSAAASGKSAQTTNRVGELRTILARLRGQVGSGDAAVTVGLASATLGDIEAFANQTDERFATTAVREAAQAAIVWVRALGKLPAAEMLLNLSKGTAEESQRVRQRDGLAQDIKDSQERYGGAMRTLSTLKAEHVTKAFDQIAGVWKERGEERETNVLKLSKKHYEHFQETQRADIPAWSKDFSDLTAAAVGK